MNKKLKIVTWNANSLKGKITEFKNFIYQHDIDVLGVCETKLDLKNKFWIPGYQTYRLDRNNRGGGVLISIKKSIEHKKINIKNNKVEIVGIKIENKNNSLNIF